MKASEIEIGMKVRISHNLQLTEKNWGVTPDMRNMEGNVYSVDDINPPSIYDNVTKRCWHFCPEDLRSVKIIPPPPPVMFDVNNLELAEQNNK